MEKNSSPLRYPGGKTRACKIIEKVLQDHFCLETVNCLVSPFFGGGSFEFYFQNKYNKKIVANDKFKPLYTFWDQAKSNKVQLVDELKKMHEGGITKEQFNDYRKTIMELNKCEEGGTNRLQQALQYFIINRCSFSGATLSGGFSQEASQKRFTKSSIQKVEALDLSNIEFYNQDFSEFMENVVRGLGEKSGMLFFLDPPYYLEKKSKYYGKNGDMHENFNHNQLFELLNSEPFVAVPWILTYNDCVHIRELYKDYKIIDVEWSYCMNQTKQSSEIIIVNKSSAQAI